VGWGGTVVLLLTPGLALGLPLVLDVLPVSVPVAAEPVADGEPVPAAPGVPAALGAPLAAPLGEPLAAPGVPAELGEPADAPPPALTPPLAPAPLVPALAPPLAPAPAPPPAPPLPPPAIASVAIIGASNSAATRTREKTNAIFFIDALLGPT
jgi:hypothetical protein